MIDFITKWEELIEEKNLLTQVFKDNLLLPYNLFNDEFTIFKAFEYDLLTWETLIDGIKAFLRTISNDSFTFYTLEPSPEAYFFKHFAKYSVAKIPINSNHHDYLEFISRDPGGNLADALIHHGGTFALYSNNPVWGIIADTYLEMGIIGFKDRQTETVFINSFEKPSIIEAVEERAIEVRRLNRMPDSDKDIFAEIIRNYKDK